MLNFKIQSNRGKENVSLSQDQPFGVFAEMISVKCGIPLDRLVLTTAFPPLVILGEPEEKLKDLTALKSGSVISAREGEPPSLHRRAAAPATSSSVPPPSPATTSASPAPATSSSPAPAVTTTASPNTARPAAATRTVTHGNVTALISMGFDPICAERSVEIAGDDLGLAVEVCQELMSSTATTGNSNGTHQDFKIRTIVRRIIDADNSCLFNALGYLMVRDKKAMNHVYRQMIASEIQGDPIKYTTDVLEGKTNAEYVTWIMNVDKWGGEIEMSIFPKHLGVEIAAGKSFPAFWCVCSIDLSLYLCLHTHILIFSLPPLTPPFDVFVYGICSSTNSGCANGSCLCLW